MECEGRRRRKLRNQPAGAVNQPGLVEPLTPTHQPLSRISSGRKRVRQDTSKLVKTLKKCQMEEDRYRSEYEKYKERYERLKLKTDKKETSPRTRINRMIGKMRISKVIREQLLFSEVMQAQVKYNYRSLRSSTSKEQLRRNMNGDIVRKYKFAETVNLYSGKRRKIKDFRRTRVSRMKKIMEEFFELDDVSRLGAGKRKICTLKKMKNQKRYLCDTLRNSYIKFCKMNTALISYASFCKMRPFWVVIPKVPVHRNMFMYNTRKYVFVGE
ncbi:hypothetical protein HHI36_018284 [Cryptolaemus montrouzieri]|uniref:Uncharacterized protein n=1 Tax=Cryptolaemus montrouzieri TaxID=559131 RepID=A0ABD2NZJ8_9CUCU